MELKGPSRDRFLADPDPETAGALIYGADAVRVADARKALIGALTGPEAEAEMRLSRMNAAEAKADPAALLDALKAVGFFPGPRAVVVDGATEPQAAPVLAALDGWAPGDAALVVTAGALKKTSKLRKAFEAHKRAVAIGLYDDPMSRAALDAAIAGVGLTLTEDGRAAVDALLPQLEPGDMRQLLEKLAIYSLDAPADAAAVAAVAPATLDADADAAILAAADGRHDAIGPLMQRLAGQGVTPVSLAIGTTRHLQHLHGIALGTSQPYGPNRQALARQAKAWGARRLEQALAIALEADLTLRSTSRAPAMAVMERALIRLAMLARARD